MPESAEPVSPTGQPLLPPKVAQWLGVVIVAALAGVGAASAVYPDSKPLQITLAVLTALAAVLGIASPGLRRVSVVLLVAGSLTLAACSAVKADASRFFKDLASCSLGAATDEGAKLIKDLDGATKLGEVDWKAKGEALGWDVLACALEALGNIIQNRLEMALAYNKFGAKDDEALNSMVEQLSRVHRGLSLANARLDGAR